MNRTCLVLATAVALAGCGSEVSTFPIGDLTGVWISSSYEFRDNATGQLSAELVSRDGALLTLSINGSVSPPTVSAQFADGLGGGWTDGGLVDINNAELTIGAGVFGIEHDGNRMTLINPITSFSYPGSGLAQSTLTIVMNRL